MALHYFGINRGNKPTTVTSGAATTSKDIEVTVELTSGADKEDVLVALESIRNAILQNKWPPA
jgi:hypothetical protein